MRTFNGFTLIEGATKGEAHDFWYGTITVERDEVRRTHRLDHTFFRSSDSARAHARDMIDRVSAVGPDHALRFARAS